MPPTTRKHRQFPTCFQTVKFEPSTSFNDIYHILDQLQCATNSFMPFMFQMSNVLSQYCPSCAQVVRKGCVQLHSTGSNDIYESFKFNSSKIWVVEYFINLTRIYLLPPVFLESIFSFVLSVLLGIHLLHKWGSVLLVSNSMQGNNNLDWSYFLLTHNSE